MNSQTLAGLSRWTLRHSQVFVQSVRYLCPILTQIAIVQQILVEISNAKFINDVSNGLGADSKLKTDCSTRPPLRRYFFIFNERAIIEFNSLIQPTIVAVVSVR
jgi:hypothetical protein